MINTKAFKEYEKKSSILTDYKVCCAHLGFNGSVNRLAERIICSTRKPKYHLSIRRAIMGIEGKRNAVVEIPSLNFRAMTAEIMKGYVKKNFDSILYDIKENGLGDYPLALMDAVRAK